MLLVAVLAFLAIADAVPVPNKQSVLPLPLALQEKYAFLMEEDPDVDKRIVGGSAVGSGGRPFQGALFRSGSFSCGGSWISPRTFLTAAHCVDGVAASALTIRYNTLSVSSGPTLQVTQVNRHASYSSSTIDYDIATLIVGTAFTPGTNAAVVALQAAGSDPSSGNAVVSGWGRLSGGGSLPDALQQATIALIDRSTCQTRWGSTNTITARMVCAHSTSTSACNGDSGGPLTLSGTQIGVVSWGSSSCLHATYPNVYAHVSNLRAWITSNTVS